LASNARALARYRQRKARKLDAGLIGVEGKGRVAEVNASAHRHDAGARAMDLKIPLLRQWQHETCDP
jgi:hypothetical protein